MRMHIRHRNSSFYYFFGYLTFSAHAPAPRRKPGLAENWAGGRMVRTGKRDWYYLKNYRYLII